MLTITLLLRAIIVGVFSTLSIKVPASSEKVSPFECGCTLKGGIPPPFSLQFFLVTLIFLVFDVELVLLFPYILTGARSSTYVVTSFLVILSLLTVGFLWEWSQGALS